MLLVDNLSIYELMETRKPKIAREIRLMEVLHLDCDAIVDDKVQVGLHMIDLQSHIPLQQKNSSSAALCSWTRRGFVQFETTKTADFTYVRGLGSSESPKENLCIEYHAFNRRQKELFGNQHRTCL